MRIDGMDASKTDWISAQSNNRATSSEDAQNVAGSGEGVKQPQISEKTVIKAIENANKAIFSTNRQLEFSIHEKTKEIMVKIIDAETKEVIKEIPPEKILDMVAKMMEMAGILVDERR